MPLNFWDRRARPSSLRAAKRHSGRQNRRRPLAETLESRRLLSTIAVDLFTDEDDGNRNPGDVSLREAILMANGSSGSDQILLKAGTYTLSITGTGENSGRTGDLDILDSVEIVGVGRDATTINGNSIDRVFDVLGQGTGTKPVVVLTGLKLTGGRTPNDINSTRDGGAINSYGAALTVQDCLIQGNTTGALGSGGRGGGINVDRSDLTVLRTVIDGNTTGSGTQLGGNGGGIAGNASTLTVRDSTVSNNRTGVATAGQGTLTAGRGGGIYIESGEPLSPGLLTVVNSSVVGNATGSSTASRGFGGGIYNYSGSALVLQGTTVRGNAAYEGGGVMTDNGTDGRILDSTIAGNTADGGRGGGLSISSARVALISGTTISGNSVLNANSVFYGGGGIFTDSREFVAGDGRGVGEIVNSTIANNSVSGTAAGLPDVAVGGGLLSTGQIDRIINTTIAGNTARQGGGLFLASFVNYTPVIGSLVNTIVADNTAFSSSANDFLQRGQVNAASNNLVEDPVGHDLINGVNGNRVGADPKLGALADNGGPTATKALLAGSPALDAGLNSGAPVTDQRGVPRPQNGVVDIGAYELQVSTNRAPIAVDDVYVGDEDATLAIPAPGVLGNDSDPDGNPLSFVLISGPGHGVLDPTSAGGFVYIPAANFNGTDSFTYRASDGTFSSNLATVTITVRPVNDAPVAVNQAKITNEDTTVSGTLTATDVDGNKLTYAVVTNPAHGTLTAFDATSGAYSYRPALNYNGPDSFTFRASDGTLISNVATVSITVNPVNDPPVPNPVSQTNSTNEDTPVSGVLTARDVDGDPITFSGDVPPEGLPAHGSVVINPDGTYIYTPARDFNGSDQFGYKVSDNSGAFNFAQVTVRVFPVNDAPVAQNDVYSVGEDGVLAVSVGLLDRLRMVSEPGDFIGQGSSSGTQPLVLNYTTVTSTFSAQTNFDNGVQIRVNDPSVVGGWTLNFAAPANAPLTPGVYTGAMRFPFQSANSPGLDVSGNGRGLNQLTGRFTVYDVAYGPSGTITRFAATFVQQNLKFDGSVDPPLTGAIAFHTTFGASGGVLANDTDADGDFLLTAQLVTGPAHGALALNPDGTFTYTPNPNFQGTDSFTYRASDGQGLSNVATVTLQVNQSNDAPVAANDSYLLNEDSPLTVSASGVLGNDTDIDGDTLTATLVAGPAHGTLTLNPDGSFLYTPAANYNGPDSFTYRAGDGSLVSGVATVTLTINPVNDAPTASNNSYSTDEDTPLTVPAPGVLGNDADVESTPLTAVLVAGPTHGVLTLNADGSFSYTPAANYTGTDAFTYRANDGAATSGVATVTLTVAPVNDAPAPTPDFYGATEDTPLNIGASAGVLANDTDIDDDVLAVSIGTGPARGSLKLNADGSFLYTPDANANGVDTFTYVISDGTTRRTGVVTITVMAVNDAPVAVNDTATTAEDTPITLSVQANDTDVDGDALVVMAVGSFTGGKAVLNPDGTVTFTPAANFYGTGSFTYIVSDSTSKATGTATITITPVNDAPVATNDAATTAEDTPVTFNVLANDTDIDGGPLVISAVTQPATGSVVVNNDGSLTFKPAANFNGQVSFAYTVSDGAGGGATATVIVIVNPVNDAPAAVDDTATTAEDTAADVAVLSNDTDQDGNSLTPTVLVGPAHGTASVNPNGTIRYTPAADYNGSDSFTYRVSDGQGGTATATVRITVTAINDAPVARNDAVTVAEDTAATGNVLVNDTDVEGQPLTASLVVGPATGVLTLNANGFFTYIPAADYNGTISFSYRANDGFADSNIAVVTITVSAVNDAPVANPDAVTTAEDTPVTFNVRTNDSDVDGNPLTITAVGIPTAGKAVLNADGTVTYTPTPNANGTASFTYTISDGAGGSATATVTVTINPVNDAPIAVDDSATTAEDTPVTVAVQANDSDVEGQSLTTTLVGSPSGGTAVVNADGTVTFTPAANFFGTASFTYTVSDGAAASRVATVTINVTPVDDAPVLTDLEFQLPENTPNGTFVGTVRGTDVDGDALAYAIVSGNESGAFSIDRATGRISVVDVTRLDYETTPRFALSVLATDPAGRSATATVIIRLTDVDESTPAVRIDVLPGDATNSINIRSRGKFEVAILFTATFDARTVDVKSLRFGRTGAEDSLSRTNRGEPRYRLADVNGDGRLDLVVEFDIESLGFRDGDTVGMLTGRTLGGVSFTALDKVTIKGSVK